MFANCETQFVNSLVVNLSYNFFTHGQVIQSEKYDCKSVFLIYKGAVVASEATSFAEPILIYEAGGIINLYQVIMEQNLPIKFTAAASSSYTV